MNIGEVLYYAPGIKFTALVNAGDKSLIDAFEKRINGYYLDAADVLNKNKHAFGAGDLCFDAIDAVAGHEFGRKRGQQGERFKKWISKLPDFKKLSWGELEMVYDDFRNGVTHEARIKHAGQFTYEIGRAVYIEENRVMINPKILLDQLREEFLNYIDVAKQNPEAASRLSNSIRKDIEEDFYYKHNNRSG